MTPWFGRLTATLLLLLAMACQAPDQSTDLSHAAEDFDTHECAACSMIIREQSAPRAQVVHRDGTRVYTCSLSDLLIYLEAPSPHGSAVSIYVEVLDPAADPKIFDSAPKPWMKAEDAVFVLGVDKPQVMGEPILAYADAESAATVATREGGQTATFSQLESGSLNRPATDTASP